MHTIMQNIKRSHEKWSPFLYVKHKSITEQQNLLSLCGVFFLLYYMGSSHHCLGFKKRMNLPMGTEPDYLFNQGEKKNTLGIIVQIFTLNINFFSHSYI